MNEHSIGIPTALHPGTKGATPLHQGCSIAATNSAAMLYDRKTIAILPGTSPESGQLLMNVQGL